MGQSQGGRNSALGYKALADKVLFAKGCLLPHGLCGVSSGSFVPLSLAVRGVVGTGSSPCSSSGRLSSGGGSKCGVPWPPWQVSKVASSSRGKGEGQPCSSGLARRCGPQDCLKMFQVCYV